MGDRDGGGGREKERGRCAICINLVLHINELERVLEFVCAFSLDST